MSGTEQSRPSNVIISSMNIPLLVEPTGFKLLLMQSLDLLLSCPPSFLAQLKQQNDEYLSEIVRANCNTQFAQAASELTEFRRVTTNLVSGMDNDSLSNLFRKTVHFTTYDAYAPFVAKFFERPCKANSVINLLAPGLPDYLASSSSTSGDVLKHFPKYNCSFTVASSSSDAGWQNIGISNTNQRRTTLRLLNLCATQMDVEDEENSLVKKIYLCFGSNIYSRNDLKLSIERDKERMGTFVLDHAVPHAAAFIMKWRSFLLIHGLFAVANRSLETMSMIFISAFVDMVRYLDKEFDMVVDCIDNGTIPKLDGVDEFRQYLEPNFLPDPERAAELRSLGRPSGHPGWCSRVWPKLRSINSIASGSAALSVPLARWYLGSNIDICPRHYASTETSKLGLPYDLRESNLYKLTKTNIIEFLGIEKGSDSATALSQLWEVEVGKRYEIVVTNRDGLWRYRLGDVIEIAGFDPTDGIPVIKYVERRNVVMIIEQLMFTEKVLKAAISSTSLVNIVDWTAAIDDRWPPRTVGFFVELASDEISDLALTAPDQVLGVLLQFKPRISQRLEVERLRKPTIRLVRPGTFSDFRQLKLDEGSRNIGQIKVPVVLPKDEYVTWFSNRVVREL